MRQANSSGDEQQDGEVPLDAAGRPQRVPDPDEQDRDSSDDDAAGSKVMLDAAGRPPRVPEPDEQDRDSSDEDAPASKVMFATFPAPPSLCCIFTIVVTGAQQICPFFVRGLFDTSQISHALSEIRAHANDTANCLRVHGRDGRRYLDVHATRSRRSSCAAWVL